MIYDIIVDMKNSKKGFAVPLLIAVIALLVIGVGVYMYKNKKTESPVVVDTETQQTNQIQQQNNTQNYSDLKTYENSKYKFSIQYPQTKYADDNKARENGIYLHPTTKTAYFYPDNVTLSFNAFNVECSSFGGYKKPDGQTLTAGAIVFQHVSEIVKTPQNKLIDNYEVFDKYFYTKNNTCYSDTLHTYTSISKLDLTDITGNKILSDTAIQKQWQETDKEIDAYKSDFREIITTFKLH